MTEHEKHAGIVMGFRLITPLYKEMRIGYKTKNEYKEANCCKNCASRYIQKNGRSVCRTDWSPDFFVKLNYICKNYFRKA